MNGCICGTVKNCAPFLNKVLDNMSKLGSLFEKYKIVIYYDNSSDNSLDILREYQKKNSNMMLFVSNKLHSKFRTHNIAVARNYCLDFVRKNKELYPFFIMMDMDDVNCKEVNIEVLRKYLYTPDWDALSFNTSPAYYDIWGLSIWPFCFSYNHYERNHEYHHIIKNFVMKRLNNLKPGQLLPCISSFNGFSIYKTYKFLDTYYDGRVRTDLFPKHYIESHAKAQKSKGIVYKDYGHVKGRYEDCEHRSFHQMARKKSDARIMISSEVLFY
jgi:hypothetical protein